MKKNIQLFITVLVVLSCKYSVKTDTTLRARKMLTFRESDVYLPVDHNLELYSYIKTDTSEFFTYTDRKYIYLIDLSTKKLQDSINILIDSSQTGKYGYLNSYCFNGKDSLYLLFDNAIVVIEQKKIQKIIPINNLDTLQYRTIRFSNVENAPIYFNKISNQLIGQIYCYTCGQANRSFYYQNIIAGITVSTGAFKTYNLSYPEIYKQNYFGFANQVYTTYNSDSIFVSFPCDHQIYILDRKSNIVSSFDGKSIFQKKEPDSLARKMSGSREEKMRHMTITPFYSEIRYDENRKMFYRFFLKEIPLKTLDGKYNTFNDKGLVLMVFNSRNEVSGEYELKNNYNSFISFVGNKGLYLLYFSKNTEIKGKKLFKILTFE